jgi:UPF0755 protein
MPKKSFRRALVTVVGSLVILGAVGAFAAREVLSYPDRKHEGSGQLITVEIARGTNLPAVASTLASAKLIERPTWFRLYTMNRGLANKVKPGRYALRDDLTPREVLDTLVKGVPEVQVQVTLPEGKNLLEVCALIGAAGVADAAELEKLARDPAWLKEQGIAGDTADGYLFPDTYEFKVPTPPKMVLERLVRRHREVFDELSKQYAKPLGRLKKDLAWEDRQVVIMASIVEKETGAPEERPRVASVFYNRLLLPSFKSHRLETDPTIRYGCTIPVQKSAACREWNPAGRLFRKQLDDEDNLYNTYQHAGLPPGPISNPGRASMAAAMDPEKSDFLYFVAKDERHHVFSKTYEEHTRWVEKYQK